MRSSATCASTPSTRRRPTKWRRREPRLPGASRPSPGSEAGRDLVIVSGNTALSCGVVRHAAIPQEEDTGFTVAVVDNGPPGSVPPDLISLTNVFIPVPQSRTDCEGNSFLLLPFVLLPVVDGNITVEDAAS